VEITAGYVTQINFRQFCPWCEIEPAQPPRHKNSTFAGTILEGTEGNPSLEMQRTAPAKPGRRLGELRRNHCFDFSASHRAHADRPEEVFYEKPPAIDNWAGSAPVSVALFVQLAIDPAPHGPLNDYTLCE
jgi:hypothetical protein